MLVFCGYNRKIGVGEFILYKSKQASNILIGTYNLCLTKTKNLLNAFYSLYISGFYLD